MSWPSGRAAASLEMVSTGVLQEARAAVGPWGTLVVRLWRWARDFEVEWTVGPVPMHDGVGKEVALRIETSLQSGMLQVACCVETQVPFWAGSRAVCFCSLL